MMKAAILAVVTLTSLTMTSPASPQRAIGTLPPGPTPVSAVPRSTPAPPMMNADLELSKTELERFRTAGLSGDGAAAEKVADYYGFILMSVSDELHWRTIAAEDGDPTAEYNLGVRLSDPSPHYDNARAIFWLKRARAAGVTGCEGPKLPGCVGELEILPGR